MSRTPIFDQLVADLGVTPRWRPSPHPRNLTEARMPDERVPDTGDVIDPTAEDPTPDEITDPAHPDYVGPFPGAMPAGGAR